VAGTNTVKTHRKENPQAVSLGVFYRKGADTRDMRCHGQLEYSILLEPLWYNAAHPLAVFIQRPDITHGPHVPLSRSLACIILIEC